MPMIRGRIDFASRLEKNALTEAVTLTIKAVPILGCVFDDSSGRPRWVDKGFSGKDILREVQGPYSDDQILELLSSDIDPAKDPQLRIFLVRQPDKDVLCLLATHMACDGVAVKQYLYSLSAAYTAITRNTPVPELPSYSRGVQPVLAGLTRQDRWRILRTKEETRTPLKEQIGVGFDAGSRDRHIVSRKILEKDMTRIRSFAKANKASSNDVLMSLFARAFCHKTETDRILLSTTMDLRKYIPEGEQAGISNYAGFCRCDISVGEEDPFVKTLEQVSGQMNRNKERDTILKSVLFWGWAARRWPFRLLKFYYKRASQNPLITFSNSGSLDHTLLRFNNTAIEDAFLSTSVKPGPYFLFSVSSYNGSCTINSNFFGSDDDKKWVEEILESICVEIEKLPS